MMQRKCPICEVIINKKFDSFGIYPRDDAKCSTCGSLERHRLIWLYITRHTHFFNSSAKKMLHIAPERIFQSLFQKHLKNNYLSGDLNNPRAMEKMDITNITYNDNSFDYIYCSHVLEHIIDDRLAMSELYRVLKPGGWAMLLVPIMTSGKTEEDFSIVSEEERLKAYGHPDHVRNYGSDYPERLSGVGFQVKTIYPKDFLTEEESLLYGITKAAGEIFFCTKEE